ncbi:MAG: hypothetical protein JNK15_20515 [Planctomycetes bacterium]|nr:hypothetical protein [Planctomycetota bacterium]
MTDFGANIFDDTPRPEPTQPTPTRKPRSRRKPKTAAGDTEPAPSAAGSDLEPAIVAPAVEPEPAVPVAMPEPPCATELPAVEPPPPLPAEADEADAMPNPFPPAEHHGADEARPGRDHRRHHDDAPQGRDPRGHTGRDRQHGGRDRDHDRPRDRQHGPDRGQRHGAAFQPRHAEADRNRQPQPNQQQQQQHKPQPQVAKPPQKPPAAEAQAVTVNAVIDLDLLQEEAVAQQGELAMARLRLGLAGSRAFGRGIALARNRNTPPAGFGLELFGDDFAGGVRLAGAAFGLAGADRVVVLAPATKPMLSLARALHAAGHKVEVCGFTNPENHPKVRLLGRDCLFVP